MANKADINTTTLFSSLISDIKSYSGSDPLSPWLSGIRKLRETLPSNIFKEKLPRFLQKCAQTFESDRRYRNDVRYIRIWLQLMDYVDEPKAVLRTMEKNKIGSRRSLFYQAYALYYEKKKKFDAADNMYRLGVQNHAEPLDELLKSYDRFLQRMERHKNKRVQFQEGRIAKRPLSDHNTTSQSCSSTKNEENLCKVDGVSNAVQHKGSSIKKQSNNSVDMMNECSQNLKADENKLCRDDSVVAKFVVSAIDGRSEAEDACHHGLVEPTINMKEAMNAINSMFREPIEPAYVGTKSNRGKSSVDEKSSNVLEVFIDDSSDHINGSTNQKDENVAVAKDKKERPPQEPLKIFVDDELSSDLEPIENQASDCSPLSSSRVDAFAFLRPRDQQSESSNETKEEKTCRKTRTLFREDTVVCRFVGSAISDEPEGVENICHHGLVDPTVNLKEAMEEINGMFGKPIDFVRTNRKKRQEKAAASSENDFGGFSILPDDEFKVEGPKPSQMTSVQDSNDLYEPTIFTKEAMDDINNLFKMPLDF